MSEREQRAAVPEPGPDAVVFRAAGNPFTVATANPRFEARDVGVAAATGGRYAVKVFRSREGGPVAPALHWHDADFQYVHVLRGEIEYQLAGGRRERLGAGDSIYQPEGCRHCVVWMSDDLELLELYTPSEVRAIMVEP